MQNERHQKKPPTWRQKSKLTTVILFIIAAVFVYFFPNEETEEPSKTGLIPVEFVKTLDGDTIRIMYEGEERKLRYLLVDTPELNHKQQGKQPYSEEAMQRNDELLKSGNLEIEFDIGEREDKYDRLLAYVYIDGVSVQEKLIEEGLARVGYIYPPNTKHLEPYKEAEESAQKAGIGIWSIEDYVTERGFK